MGRVARVHFGVVLVVVLQHPAVVHLVDVVAGKDDHVLRLLAADGIDVLVHSVCGAHVPVGAGALHGWQQLEELAQFLGHDAGPAFAHVPVERECLVLGEDVDLAQAGVDAVGEGDVDDAVMTAKGDGRFGAIASEWKEALPGPARQQYSESISHVHVTCPRPSCIKCSALAGISWYLGAALACMVPERRRITYPDERRSLRRSEPEGRLLTMNRVERQRQVVLEMPLVADVRRKAQEGESATARIGCYRVFLNLYSSPTETAVLMSIWRFFGPQLMA